MSQGASGLTTLREKGTSWDPRPPVLPCLGPCRKGDRERTAFEASVCTCEQYTGDGTLALGILSGKQGNKEDTHWTKCGVSSIWHLRGIQ